MRARPERGVRVEVQPQPWTAAHQKLLTGYAGNSLPDVSQIGNTWVAELTAIGTLSPTPPEAANLLASTSIDKHVRAWEKPSDHVPVAVELKLEAA